MAEAKRYGPSPLEFYWAIQVAWGAQQVVTAILNHMPMAEPFQELCHDLEELLGHIPGGISIEDRAEELGLRWNDWSDAILEKDEFGQPRWYRIVNEPGDDTP